MFFIMTAIFIGIFGLSTMAIDVAEDTRAIEIKNERSIASSSYDEQSRTLTMAKNGEKMNFGPAAK